MDIRVVIPCYNEPAVLDTIESLFACKEVFFRVEIIVVVNSYSISSDDIKEFNKRTFSLLKEYSGRRSTSDFILTPLLFEDLPGHQTGAGVPRKLGMDQAVECFYSENNPWGIVVSLDADCVVEDNYLVEIYKSFKRRKLKSATLEFHHPVEHLPKEDRIRKSTEVYEEYLRYYRVALAYTGYPYAYYTIGSAFAVTAETYRQVGGMGKQQAGEDFYFLQKVFPLGKTYFIRSTCVFPAARISDRVPFGTGPAIQVLSQDRIIKKLSYQAEAFNELKSFFESVDSLFKIPEEEIIEKSKTYPLYLQNFLSENAFFEKIKEINNHTATLINFRKRFFNYFNAFRILKYLNYVHPDPYSLSDVKEQYEILNQLLLKNIEETI
ncbi:glycosyltransferase [Bacteroidales bacterium OttesenSCG-928-M06]|nr:glycosyltransferase [Bacteroidales bacterium OttesenSCG-928-M06]